MRAVVTGGAGFIGSNLVDALVARGDEVVVVDDLSTGKRDNLNGGARLVELDIRSLELAKLAGEEYLAAWNRLHGTRHTTLRFGNVYGPRQEATLEGGVVAIFLEAMADGRETKIYGDGSQTRDFVHVDDVVSA